MLLPYNPKIGQGRRLIQDERVAGIGEAVLAYLWINGKESPALPEISLEKLRSELGGKF
jgi:hypothetical protein